ncbi:hypothetical protein [Mycobacterium sp. 852002-10029_SCH5224772]|uniref:hypothetical protein n=1 Tax=Mycobacterium sp. 852002-10029_SCH5224772 TaxID=1834083 RepID=UPI0008010FCE|nr:hypothetical protein [Mycobacterium sp. 852002-10029_SCH5224772]OBF05340.1 hypothetical protein A5775_24310 [Mycobacterium sp. 852002-10029_SCH5224772]
MTPFWQLFVSGAVGSSLTYAFTWWREHKRMQDAYRAPQRQAIGDILAAAHELQLRVLNWRRVLTDLIEEIRQDRADNLPAISAQIRETESAYAAALLEMRRALEVGSLTVVDVRCWQEMVVVAAAFSRFDEGPNGGEISTADAAEQFVARIGERADQLRAAVSVLVKTANERVTPAESRRSRRQRRNAQRQLAEYLRHGDVQTPDGGPDE